MLLKNVYVIVETIDDNGTAVKVEYVFGPKSNLKVNKKAYTDSEVITTIEIQGPLVK